jgi:hypothetical protein
MRFGAPRLPGEGGELPDVLRRAAEDAEAV